MMGALSILVADDSADDRLLIRRYLRHERYVVRQATSGADALEQLARQPFDVLILDQHLGEMRGNDVISALRSQGRWELAIIVLTGSEVVGEDPLELGADDFLKKDEITKQVLRRTVDNAVVKARMRHKLQRSQAQLEAALEEVTRHMEFESRLLGVVGHDLRSPLQSIRIGIHTLQRETLSARGQSTLALVSRSVEHMIQMVRQLLDLTLMRKQGAFPIQRIETDVFELVAVRMDELRTANPDRLIVCECSGAGNAHVDPTAFGQLVHNLVGNAILHGSREHPVTVRVHGDADQLEMTVSNFGPPLSAEQLVDLFEPFVRGSGPSGGLGLGLYIAREIARAHGGSLSAASDAGLTTFCVVLPR